MLSACGAFHIAENQMQADGIDRPVSRRLLGGLEVAVAVATPAVIFFVDALRQSLEQIESLPRFIAALILGASTGIGVHGLIGMFKQDSK